MVNQMYVQGVLKVECFGFRLVWADSPLGHSVNPDRSFFSVPSKKKPSKGDMSRPSKRKRANSLSEPTDIRSYIPFFG